MRYVQPGINWIQYYADTEAEAREYFKELTGSEAYDSTIVPPVVRNPAGEYDSKYGFRLRRR